tara:strand:+ start:5160 stop:5822 length:663 start_codon:yes stop_codon:yes gene_type:complete
MSYYKDLHSKGYFKFNINIHRNIKDICEKQITFDNASYIFNNKNNDKRRIQSTLFSNKYVKQLKEDIYYFLKNNNLISDNLYINRSVILKSFENCKRQQAHCDYLPEKNYINLLKNEIEDVPLVIIISLQDNTKIDVWSESINWMINEKKTNINRETIELMKNDIFIFRSDLIHAGSEYNKSNIRIHMYLDNKKLTYKSNYVYFFNTYNERWTRKIKDKN